MSQASHISVLLHEAVDALIVNDSGLYVDGTFGRGGHSGEIMSRLSSRGQLIAIDKDSFAVREAENRFGGDERFSIMRGSFAQMDSWLDARGSLGQVSGVLLDLGVSSPQLDEAERGFSFMQDGPLDMRMDTSSGITAADWVNKADESEIAFVLKEYGEEKFSRRMARAIIEQRVVEPILTTKRLATIVSEANPAWEKGKHPATRAFQAIRIYINNELDDLDLALKRALDILSVGGRLVVISFHSLEDRRVKRFMRQQAKGDPLPVGVPVTDEQLNRRLKIVGKPIKPSAEELQVNPRARSAVMRVAEKIG